MTDTLRFLRPGMQGVMSRSDRAWRTQSSLKAPVCAHDRSPRSRTRAGPVSYTVLPAHASPERLILRLLRAEPPVLTCIAPLDHTPCQ